MAQGLGSVTPRLGIGLGSVKVGGLYHSMPGPGQGPPKLQCDTQIFVMFVGLGSAKVGGLKNPMPGPGQGPPKLQ